MPKLSSKKLKPSTKNLKPNRSTFFDTNSGPGPEILFSVILSGVEGSHVKSTRDLSTPLNLVQGPLKMTLYNGVFSCHAAYN
jgi:hypothetical protein